MGTVNNQLSLLSETLHLPDSGVSSFTARGLNFTPAATSTDLLNIGHRLFAVRSYTKWALGSLFAEMQARKTATDLKRRSHILPHPENNTGGGPADFAALHELDPKEYREVVGVFTFYSQCGETPALSFEHHREAMWGVDDGQPDQLNRALDYLRFAYANTLTVTQLRRHIRSAHATEPSEPTQLELASYAVVFDFMRFAKRELQEVQDYSPDRARLILSDLGEATVQYIDALKLIASGDYPSRQRTRVVKAVPSTR